MNCTVSVEYVHSVSLTKVIDVYEVNESGIYALEERWQQFDAGQPLDFQRVENGYFVKKLDEYLGESWEYWFIPLNDAKVRVNGKLVLRGYGVLRLEVREVPLLLRGW